MRSKSNLRAKASNPRGHTKQFLFLLREWLPTPVFLSGEFHRQRSLASYSTWGYKEVDMTEQLTHRVPPHSCYSQTVTANV